MILTGTLNEELCRIKYKLKDALDYYEASKFKGRPLDFDEQNLEKIIEICENFLQET